MSENVRYWLWLQRALGAGANIKPVIDEFGSAKELYDANLIEWRMSPSLTAVKIKHLEETPITVADEIIYTCEENGWQIIDYEDERYPKRLKEIINPPAVLYVDGELPDVDSLITIGVVGTRKASEYAVKVTHIMSRGIAEAGALVVSGGALGVDTYAHRGALAAGGKTVAVLGCGLGTKYLSSNSSLRDAIRHNGALVTEFEPFTPAGKRTFPIRNRIISGLSLGVLVVEAGEKSGSLITAKYAIEQNRDVYAVPVSVLSTDFSGTNRLIDDGAKVATKPEHLIEGYLSDYPTADISKIRSIDELINDEQDSSANVEKSEDKYSFDNLEKGRKTRLENEKKAVSLDGDLKAVYDAIEENFTHIDTIIEKSGLSSQKVTAAVIQLEMLGIIESASGKRYKKA
ncbi:MAG: DNA-processing protein DprA [Eubacteriales bacterium]|nr:DNA-processing protein DprA [Eubacteriales bacterium]